MKELVIVSGKGGTGKTSVTAALATLAQNCVLADCDVDAADLHLILKPTIEKSTDFISGHEAIIRQDDCTQCGTCVEVCRFNAIDCIDGKYTVSPFGCEGCGVCVAMCPAKAIDFPDSDCGKWYQSSTRCGAMIHAALGIAAENSGKLVSLVRSEARKLAKELNADWIIVDGPPGIGCPVIASIGGADALLAVTEPSLSGKHDLGRLMQLAKHFKVPVYVCINKSDINPEISREIEHITGTQGGRFLGCLPYDSDFTQAQIAGKSIIEFTSKSPSTNTLRDIWITLEQHLQPDE
ncbi:MAG: (4Fe-4S)-binding protein [Spartobacteria bacterium]|nr:(4Fe-4S)-binding protein [Spartobacteria bacterium]